MGFQAQTCTKWNIGLSEGFLVIEGFHEESGVDFLKIYSLVIKATTIHVILTLASPQGWELWQLDVENASLC